MYPMDATNPNVRPSSAIQMDVQSDGQLEDIEYPSLSDITMKEQSISGQGSMTPQPTRPGAPPVIDRSSKLAALKNYNSRRDLLKEQNEIAERLLANQRECLNEEMELAEIIKTEAEKKIKEESIVADDDDQGEGTEDDKINESRFKIMQLDNSIEDAMLKKQLVEETKPAVPDKDHQEAQENMRIIASIRQKEEEIQEIRAKRMRMAQEREEKLRLAKEQKKALVNKTNNVAPVKPTPTHVPKQPLVDRSVKPVVAADFDDNIRRDFAPVYGQVVSKYSWVESERVTFRRRGWMVSNVANLILLVGKVQGPWKCLYLVSCGLECVLS